jgi:pimeloyl-ACP methyl ester carboxylesterase
MNWSAAVALDGGARHAESPARSPVDEEQAIMDMARRSGMYIDLYEAGQGPPVVLVHSSVSGNRQWKKLASLLGDRYRVLAPNLTGYGATPAWHDERPLTLDDAAAVVLAVCATLDGPIRLVGHSWGGALALAAAHRLGPKVSHLALYEPMLRGLLAAHGRHEAWLETEAMYADVRRLAAAGRWHDLGRRFTDYFGGDGAWDATPTARQDAVAAAIPPNVHEWDAASPPIAADAFGGTSAQVLLMCGSATRRALRDTAAVLRERFPDWPYEDVPGCGHMAPLSDPERINPLIADFLDTPVR